MNARSPLRIILMPMFLGLTFGLGIYIGNTLNVFPAGNADDKITTIIDYIQQEYVDTVNRDELIDRSIEKILEQLDPHSGYIPASELQAANEPLEGNFEGIGIEFHIQDDSIMVVSPISGGPSERVGITAGDRIVKVNGKKVAGTGITNEQVQKLLKGKGGTEVKVGIYRRGQKGLLDFEIVRGKIPINSLDAAYMVNTQTGYIKLSRFSATTNEEFTSALKDLLGKGMKSLIFDLRGNPGGYLEAAKLIADELIGGKKLIVYTQGKSRPRTDYMTEKKGLFEEGRLIILIDEGSASAAEIVSGAVQDWDRGTIVGRRSFGKGMVQEQAELPDGSAIRLTIARYYTPTGRSIQKPYSKGISAYEEELYERYRNGELMSQDSIQFADSLKYKTPAGRIVYGGGGIMPDVFVPIDTSHESEYLTRLFASGSVNQYAYDYVDRNRGNLKKFTTAEDFRNNFSAGDEFLQDFVRFSEKRGVKKDNEGLSRSSGYLKTQLKASIARLLWKNEGMYPILQEMDPAFVKALSLISRPG